jgi:hypothetical protein
VANASILAERVLLAFVADIETEGPFLVPVRFASVVSAEPVADMFIFRLQVEAYANLDDFPFGDREIRQGGRRAVDKLIELNGKVNIHVLSSLGIA